MRLKKFICGMMMAATMMTAALVSYAADTVTAGHQANFIDADGDGICDNWATGGTCGNRGACGTQDRSRRHDGCGMRGNGSRRYFTDANGDGICDHYGTGYGQSQK